MDTGCGFFNVCVWVVRYDIHISLYVICVSVCM